MATLDERVSFVEGRIAEDTRVLNDLRDAIAALDLRMDRRSEAIERRISSLEDKCDRGFAALNGKMSRQFMFLVGLLVTNVAGIAAAVLSR